MSYATVPTVATSDSWTAAQHNTYVRDNLTAIWVGTTAGDLDYYTSSSAKARLAFSAGGMLYAGTATAPAWTNAGTQHAFMRYQTNPEFGGLVYKRQGGTATSWQATGTTTYTPTSTLIQTGSISVSMGGGDGDATVTYPQVYTQRPVIFLSPNRNAGRITCRVTGDGTAGFTASLADIDLGTGAVELYWLAIGA